MSENTFNYHISLIIDNDESMLEQVNKIVDKWYKEARSHDIPLPLINGSIVWCIEADLKEFIENIVYHKSYDLLISELISLSMAHINWYELANDYYKDYLENLHYQEQKAILNTVKKG